MELSAQKLNSVRILLDKPISIISTEAIINLLSDEFIITHKCIAILCNKKRSDLIIHLLSKYQLNSIESSYILQQQINQVMQYPYQHQQNIFKSILTHIFTNEQDKIKYGYSELISKAIKITNQQTKNKLLILLMHNIDTLYQNGDKKIIIYITNSYLLIFMKFTLYVPSFLKVIKVLDQLHEESYKQSLERQLPEMWSKVSREEVIGKIVLLCSNSKRSNMSIFKNQALKVLECLGKSGRSHIRMESVQKVIMLSKKCLYFKLTMEQARKTYGSYTAIMEEQENQDRLKMMKKENYGGQQVLDEPFLIENMIEDVGNYRIRHQVERIKPIKEGFNNHQQQFLRKGQGCGGGKVFLREIIDQKNNSYWPSKYDEAVEMCLSKYEVEGRKRKKQDEQSQSKEQEYQPNKDEQCQQIMNLIDLAYCYKFEH